MEQSPSPLAHMESPWVGELQPPTPVTLDMDLLDKQPGLVWSLMEGPLEHGVEVNQLVRVRLSAVQCSQRQQILYMCLILRMLFSH